jgi:hypothetical protein
MFTKFSSSEFVQKHYVAIKKENPKLPILIRECSGVQPRLWTRFGKCEMAENVKSKKFRCQQI